MLGEPRHPQFEREFGHLETHSLGDPGYTDAVEFDDGKLMLNEEGDVRHLDWETLRASVDHETLVDAIDGTKLFGIGYWAIAPHLASILDGLRTEVWPSLGDPPAHLLVDPADIRKLNEGTVRETVAATERLDDLAPVTLSANRAETRALADAVAEGPVSDPVQGVFDAVDVTRFVSHGVDRSRSHTATDSASVAVPRVANPALTTSAGDHFNAGFSFGLVEGLTDREALVAGNALAREFVRTGKTPTYEAVVGAVGSYLEGFE
uniref:PfkB family carbohydrate kinase n=2 Tax=Haloarcula TaxID=2237 RepID=UPI0023E783D4|nr:hypothetical protein [Halomicroarcula sp. SYNS111]